ncbi:D-2-hydroxyacid dehydrogenase [Danxiaibacter flavus]|uniref:D-2-hydroxyacid dehydrogenase n=1 Tax=Danxiaibacter flavus TaxID=3049108 RepID=A0ABV3ZCA4_9BACT|nr:D-2-hydroxyacid dehydrogenase [Chitinophagaceae bacterium DXS]
MKIVVLDGYTLNPGDLSWDGLKELGEIQIHDRSPKEQVLERSIDADILLTNKAIVSKEVIEQCKNLKYIGVLATGYNIVDIKAAKEKGIIVSNVPAYGTNSVAQLTFALLLEITNGAGLHSNAVKGGEWTNSADFSFWHQSLVELAGKTLGIVGLGTIGRAVAKIALAMEMKVIAHHKHPDRDKMEGVSFVSLEECFEQSDVVSLHCPLNDQNKGFVNASLLKKMKPSAILLNTSRGPLINEADLAEALNNNVISGAGLDVLSVEPPSLDNPLIGAKNCIITPHIAWATLEARKRLLNKAVENLKMFLEGKAQNQV